MQSATAPAKIAPQRATISLNSREDIRYWMETLGLGEEQLRLLVKMHGTAAAPIRAALSAKKSASKAA